MEQSIKIFLLFLLGICCVVLAAPKAADGVNDNEKKPNGTEEGEAKKKEPFDGVEIGLLSKPTICDVKAKRGDVVKVTFNVTTGHEELDNFETRYEKEPIEFVIGDGAVIRGFEVGIIDMCVDEMRFIKVPPQFHYDVHSLGAAPARSNYYFVVRLLSIAEAKTDIEHMPDNIFKSVDVNDDKLLSTDEVRNYLNATGVKDVPGDGGLKQMVREIFREEDTNHSGTIDLDEFHGRKRDQHDYKEHDYQKVDL